MRTLWRSARRGDQPSVGARRVLKNAGVLDRHNPKSSRKGKGFHQPNGSHRHWHIDIAYLCLGGTFYHMCSILDGYSRFIVHSEIREQMTEQDVETILQRAREKFPGETPRIISDNGPQFIAKDFKPTNAARRCPHRTIKGECIRPGTPLCLDDARRLVSKYVTEYNEVRLHSAIGYVAPVDKLHGREDAIFAERDRKLQEAREERARNRKRQNENDLSPTQAIGCYTEDAWAEDRATVETDPSAGPGPEAKSGAAARSFVQPTAPPHFLSASVSMTETTTP